MKNWKKELIDAGYFSKKEFDIESFAKAIAASVKKQKDAEWKDKIKKAIHRFHKWGIKTYNNSLKDYDNLPESIAYEVNGYTMEIKDSGEKQEEILNKLIK